MKPRTAFLLLPVMLLAACINLDPVQDATRRFLPVPAPAQVAVVAGLPTLGLREVSLPGYLLTTKIAIRTSGAELSYSDFNLWGDQPDAAAALTLVRQLRLRFGAERVDSFPWTDGVPHDVELRVKFDCFEANADGTLNVSGRYILTKSPRNDQAALVVPFDYAGTWIAGDYASMAQSLGNALDKLAADVAAKLAAK
jgi:uncharacterized lipoprotein YmbA